MPDLSGIGYAVTFVLVVLVITIPLAILLHRVIFGVSKPPNSGGK